MSTLQHQKKFPVWQMSVISLIRFAEPISFTSLFPYVYFMVRDFNVAEDPAEISRYTGYLAAAFSLAQFCCCIQWGRLSNRIGRKPVLITGLVGSAISLLIFGFATNFYVAMGARAMMGALNGNMAVIQTTVGEIATERSHQTIAFSILPLLWNVGCVFGPLIGGSRFLTRPKASTMSTPYVSSYEKSLGNSYESFLDNHPYALSNIAVAVLLCFSAIICFLFLEETEHSASKRYDAGILIGDQIRSKFGFTVPFRSWKMTEADCQMQANMGGSTDGTFSNETTPMLPSPTGDSSQACNDLEDGSDKPVAFLSRRSSIAIARRYSTPLSNQLIPTNISSSGLNGISETLAYSQVFTNKVKGPILANFTLAFHFLIFNEFVPVLLAGTFQDGSLKFPFHLRGGFSWKSPDIGSLLSSTGLAGCFFIMVVFPFLDRHLKTIYGFRFACLLFPISYLLLPYLAFLLPEHNPALQPWVSTVCIYFCAALTVLGSSLAYPQVTILIYRATNPSHRALVNSSAMSATSLARFLAPLLFGSLMSHFDGKGLGSVPWNLLALIALMAAVLAFQLEEHDEDVDDNVDTS
ncbi:putative membrane protein [Meyerozyma sp. JA9]|nr:putative membrane protein [Meyerozyma sp. JA9]